MGDVGNQKLAVAPTQGSIAPIGAGRPRGFTLPPPPKPSGITILHKIMGLIVGLVVVLVGTLAIYFPTRQVADYRETLANKAATYGEVLANELRPAVAFDDRETAREIFEGVAEDRDVVAIALYKQDGTSLETRGMLAPATVAALGSTPAPFADTIGERVVAIESVTSLEGPKGKLVLELSTASLQQLRHRALWIGLIVGICGIAMGAVAAWLIGRSLANRLRALAEVATAVAAGHLDTRPVIDGGNDEIGVMAHAFHKMLVQLRTLIAEMQKSARDEQTRLEKEVAQRTQALDRRNDDMRLLLDNAAQGFLTLDRNAVISGERSASVDLWLSPAPGASFGECVEKLVPDFGAMFAADWSQAISDDLPLELTITQLPRSLAIETRHFSIEYRPILDEGGKLDKMMLVISDISEHFERQRAEQDEREITYLFRIALEDLGGLDEFVRETSRIVDEITLAATHEPVVLKRLVHTLKGNSASFGLQTIASICHEMESSFALDSVDVRKEDSIRLRARWESICEKLGAIDTAAGRNLTVKPAEHAALLAAIDGGISRQEIRRALQSWKLESVEVRFRRIASNLEVLAERLGKGPVEVHIEANGVRLPHDVFAPFWQSFTHVTRNAVDHGLEMLDERRQQSKPEATPILLRASMGKATVSIEIEDAGRGIDWEKVRKAAANRGFPHETRHDLVEALFADGVSTRNEANEWSGRGIGLGATREACRAIGGEVEVWTESGKGTRFRFVWPRAVLGVDEASAAAQDTSASGYMN